MKYYSAQFKGEYFDCTNVNGENAYLHLCV